MTRLAAQLIGRYLFTPDGKPAGRVVAVIHRARGGDVLVEKRHRLLFRRSSRMPLDHIEQCEDGRLVVRTPPVRLTVERSDETALPDRARARG